MTRLNVLCIVLDGMPWLSNIFVELNRLKTIDWHLSFVEGVALPHHCTSWMPGIAPRLSRDGTTEFLKDISTHPRVSYIAQPEWDGKVTMCNAALQAFREPGILLEQDSDELWTVEQYETLVRMFRENPDVGSVMFRCRYFVGPNKVVEGRNCFGDRSYEWLRAWRWKPGMSFLRHEPPMMKVDGRVASKDETEGLGLVFDHYSYALRKTCQEKAQLYGPDYAAAVQGWEQLQKQPDGRLKDYFPWVDESARFRMHHE